MFKFLKDESGATVVEYGLIAVAVALALIVILPMVLPDFIEALNTLFGLFAEMP